MLELETRKLGYFEPWLSEPLLRHDVQWLDALVANAVPLPPLLWKDVHCPGRPK